MWVHSEYRHAKRAILEQCCSMPSFLMVGPDLMLSSHCVLSLTSSFFKEFTSAALQEGKFKADIEKVKELEEG